MENQQTWRKVTDEDYVESVVEPLNFDKRELREEGYLDEKEEEM